MDLEKQMVTCFNSCVIDGPQTIENVLGARIVAYPGDVYEGLKCIKGESYAITGSETKVFRGIACVDGVADRFAVFASWLVFTLAIAGMIICFALFAVKVFQICVNFELLSEGYKESRSSKQASEVLENALKHAGETHMNAFKQAVAIRQEAAESSQIANKQAAEIRLQAHEILQDAFAMAEHIKKQALLDSKVEQSSPELTHCL
jgi:hypothetical protein